MALPKQRHGLFVAITFLFCVSQLSKSAATARKQLDATTAGVGEDPKPIWHRQFSIDFNGTFQKESLMSLLQGDKPSEEAHLPNCSFAAFACQNV
jgi:hypothetical protein